jgi:hypothetical protein
VKLRGRIAYRVYPIPMDWARGILNMSTYEMAYAMEDLWRRRNQNGSVRNWRVR